MVCLLGLPAADLFKKREHRLPVSGQNRLLQPEHEFVEVEILDNGANVGQEKIGILDEESDDDRLRLGCR